MSCLFHTTIPFVLASASPRRRELMERAGLPCLILPAREAETAPLPGDPPDETVRRLALAKAAEVANRILKGEALSEGNGPDGTRKALVIGADTVVSLEQRILGKPRDRADAAAMLRELSGRTHTVWTGLAIVETDDDAVKILENTAVCTQVEIAVLTDDEIDAYLASGEADDKAGAYGIQGRFAVHVRGIRGDYFNVVGLPLETLYQSVKHYLRPA